eukprot:6118549-Alexandrium_andersonii.AAC.1
MLATTNERTFRHPRVRERVYAQSVLHALAVGCERARTHTSTSEWTAHSGKPSQDGVGVR